jgi:membrane fusion protein, multidrug efflux system
MNNLKPMTMKIIQSKSIIIILMISMLFSTCVPKTQEEAREQSLPVRIEQVKTENFQAIIRSSGRLFPGSEQKLGFKTGGIINKIYVSEGEEVKQGQLLAELKVNEFKAMVRQASEAVAKTDRDFKRVSNLYRDTVATLEQYENALTALKLAESQLEIAQFNLQYSSIHAPGSGKILKKLAEPDEMIAPGYPVFLFGGTKGTWLLKVNVTDREVIMIKNDDDAVVRFDAHPDKEFPGRVSEKSVIADPYTGLFEITVDILPSDYQLVTGFIGRADIYSGEKISVVSVPVEALLEAQGAEGLVHLYVEGKAVRRNIEIFRIDENKILVSRGLEGDELVVTEGTAFIKQGSKLKIINSM